MENLSYGTRDLKGYVVLRHIFFQKVSGKGLGEVYNIVEKNNDTNVFSINDNGQLKVDSSKHQQMSTMRAADSDVILSSDVVSLIIQ